MALTYLLLAIGRILWDTLRGGILYSIVILIISCRLHRDYVGLAIDRGHILP